MEWIKTSEQLPIMYDSVLVLDEREGVYFIEAFLGERGWCTFHSTDDRRLPAPEYWLPIPEHPKYKEQKQQEKK